MKKRILTMLILLSIIALSGCSESNLNCATQDQVIALNENIKQIGEGQETLNNNLQTVVDNQVKQRENMKIMQENILNNCKR